jgi:photosystem II stability/assembly factor-like uncharacterized protein
LDSTSSGEELIWRSTGGPEGGSTTQLAVNGNGLDLIALSSRVFYSRDGGVHWSEGVKGLPPKGVSAIAMRPGEPPDVYAWVSPEGIYHSADGGETWSLRGDIPAGNEPRGRTHLVADSELPGFLLRITQEITQSYRRLWVERSFDFGATWQPTLHLPEATSDGYFLVRAAGPAGAFFFCCDGSFTSEDPGLLWATSDRGESWRSLPLPWIGEPDCLVCSFPNDVAGSSGSVFAATYSGLWETAAADGSSWTKISDEALSDVVVDRSGQRIYARGPQGSADSVVLRSSDGGSDFESVSLPVSSTSGSASKLALSDAEPAHVWFATDQGVMRSLDGGRTWTLNTTGLVNSDVAGVIADPLGPGGQAGALVASEGRLFRFQEGDGSDWSSLHRAEDASTYYEPSADALDPLLVYYSTFEGLYRSADGGLSWEFLRSLVDYSEYPEVRLLESPLASRIHTHTLFAIDRVDFASEPSSYHLSRSMDRGSSWNRVSILPGEGGPNTWFVDTPSGSWVTASFGGIWTSVDAGATWSHVWDAGFDYPVQDLAVDPADGNHLLAAAGPTVLDSLDGGRSWRALGALPWAWQVSVSRLDPRRLVASGEGIFLSEDAGATWRPANAGLSTLDVSQVEFVGENDSLYAAAAGAGLWLAQEVEDPALLPCVEGPATLCLAGDRFRVEVTWLVNQDVGRGNAVPLSEDSGSFWFFDPANLELIVKLLDGSAVNGHYWVFFGALSDVEYTIHVTDTLSGLRRAYTNKRGEIASRGDVEAFPSDARHQLSAATSAHPTTQHATPAASAALDFHWTTPVVAGSTVVFIDTAPAPSTAVGRSLSIRTWRFGDGSQPLSTLAAQTRYAYEEPGTYAVTLAVGGETLQKTVEVISEPDGSAPGGGTGGEPLPKPGALRISGIDEAFVGDEVSLSATARGCRPDKNGWAWSIDGGTILGASNRSNVRVRWSVTGAKSISVANDLCTVAVLPSHVVSVRERPSGAEGCRTGPEFLCLLGARFEVHVDWQAPGDAPKIGQALALTADTGYFWFFDSQNVEVMVKVLDGRALNGSFWVFFGALSNVEYTLNVRDTVTGRSVSYLNQGGQFGSRADTAAFPP